LKAIVAGNIDKKIISELEKIGFELKYTKPDNNVLPGLGYHPDMQLSVIDKNVICNPTFFEYYKDFICSAGYVALQGKTALSCNYPGDIAYNISVVSNYVFHNTKYTDSEIIKHLKKRELVNVRQGYCGCSICNVGCNAIITADTSIYKAAQALNVDALLISPGNIYLEGFDYGFIGGASFCYDKTMYFFGKVSVHPDFSEIENFCKNRGFGIYELSDGILSDYGSLIILD